MLSKNPYNLMVVFISVLFLNTPHCFSHDKKIISNQHEMELIKLNTGNEQSFDGMGVSHSGDKVYLTNGNKGVTAISLKDKKTEIIDDIAGDKLRGNFYDVGALVKNGLLYTTMNEWTGDQQATLSSVLQVYDLTTKKIVRSYDVQGSRRNNDNTYFYHIAVDSKGIAYISSVRQPAVYWVDTRDPNSQLKILIQHHDLNLIHGIDISPDDSKLFVTAYRGGLGSIDLKRRKLTLFYDEKERQSVFKNNDGIRYYNGVIYAVGHNALRKYTLNKAEDSILHSELLILNHEKFNNPRWLEIVNGWVYILANRDLSATNFGSKSSGIGKQQDDSYILKYKL